MAMSGDVTTMAGSVAAARNMARRDACSCRTSLIQLAEAEDFGLGRSSLLDIGFPKGEHIVDHHAEAPQN